jgi:hypothetical protein
MVDISYALRGSNNEQIVFDNSNYVLNPGFTGFGITPTTVRIEPSAGVGGVFRHSRRGVRDVDLPVTILGSSREDVQTKLRRLARITQDARGPMVFRATYGSGEQLFLNLHYTGGAESQWGSDNAGRTFCRWVLSAQAPQPFWESLTKQTISIAGGGTGRGLLPELSKLKVSSSEALGEVTITSNADVEVYPVWTINGPVTDFTVSDGVNSFTIEGTIAEGETITVDTENKTVTDGGGNNVYSLLGPAPKLFSFQPGETLLEVTGTDTNSSTLVNAEYALRYEVVH